MSANDAENAGNNLTLNALERRLLEMEIKWRIALGVGTVLGFSFAAVLAFAIVTADGLRESASALAGATTKLEAAQTALDTKRDGILGTLTAEERAATKRLSETVEAAVNLKAEGQMTQWLGDERARRERHDAVQDRWINHIYQTAVANPETDRGANGYWQGGIRLKQSQVAAELP